MAKKSKKGKRSYPATDAGTDPVQRQGGEAGNSPSMGGPSVKGAGLNETGGAPKSGKP